MPKFSQNSLNELSTCHNDLIKLCNEVIKYIDFTVLEGFRNERDQEIAYAKGNTKLHWPFGNHNKNPSLAVDIAPYPVDWTDSEKARQRFVLLAGFMLCKAQDLGIKIRWGGDWNSNMDTRDEKSFRDYPHFELVL